MTSPTDDLHALDGLCDAIEEALAGSDWARIQELEARARPLMAGATSSAQGGGLAVDSVVQRLQRLQILFDRARSGATIARDEASAALKATEKTRQAAQAYLKNARR